MASTQHDLRTHCDVHKLRNNHDVRDEGAVSGGGAVPDSNPTGIRTTDGTTVNDDSGNANLGVVVMLNMEKMVIFNRGMVETPSLEIVVMFNMGMVVMPSLGMPVLVRNLEMVVMPNLGMPVLMRNLEMVVMLNPVAVLRHLVMTIKMNQAAQRVVVHNLVALPVMVVLFPKVVSVNMEALVDKSAASNLITGATLMNQRALPQQWQLLCRRCQTHMTKSGTKVGSKELSCQQ